MKKEKKDFFISENAIKNKRKEYISPSKKYKLITTPFQTNKGCWNYTQGLVYKGDELVTEVQRNF